MVDTVDYTTDKGHKTVAEQSRWFKHLPPILMMQQNRVKFDAGTGTYKKVCTPLQFDTEVYLDRYFIAHRARTTQTRRYVNQLRHDLAKLEREIAAITHYKGRGHGIHEALGSVIDYLEERGDGTDAQVPSKAIVELLTQYRAKETENLEKLREGASACRAKISSAYDDFPRSSAYSLFGVWVHSGVAGSGHYWAYMRAGSRKKPAASSASSAASSSSSSDATTSAAPPAAGGDSAGISENSTSTSTSTSTAEEKKEKEVENTVEMQEEKQWLKFNDIQVTTAGEATVMMDAIGGNGSSTAYFLIYMENSMFAELQQSFLPDAESEGQYVTVESIRKEIEESNAKFMETLEKFNKSASEDKVSKFMSTYENRLSETQLYAEEAIATCGEKDLRIKSFYAYLCSVGLEEMARIELIKDLYAQTFERGIERDVGSSYYGKVSERLGEGIMQMALNAALERQGSDELRAQFQEFRRVAQFYSAGLGFFIERRFDNAMTAFLEAIKRDHSITAMPAKRQFQIENTIRFCLLQMLNEAELQGNILSWQDCVRVLGRVAFYGNLLPRVDPVFLHIKERISNILYRRTLHMPEEGYMHLKRSMELLEMPPRPHDHIPPKLAEIGRGETEKWEQLARRMLEQITIIRECNAPLWHRVMPPHLPMSSANKNKDGDNNIKSNNNNNNKGNSNNSSSQSNKSEAGHDVSSMIS